MVCERINKEGVVRIIVDTDPGIDDAIAILLALRSPAHLKVEGISIVHGNTTVTQCETNAYRVLEALEQLGENELPTATLPGLTPVYRGAADPLQRSFVGALETHGNDGMGNLGSLKRTSPFPESASSYLARMVQENPGQLTITPIGPLTNLARALGENPGMAEKMQRVVVMGGSQTGGNCSPVSEFNFWADPHAADAVLTAGIPEVVVVGLDVTRKVILTPTLRELLYQLNTPLSRFIHRITRMYNDFHYEYEGLLGCVINDPLVMAYLIDPSVLKLKPAYVRVVTDGVAIGQSVVDDNGKWNNGKCNCLFAYDVNVKRFFEILFHTVIPEKVDVIDRFLAKEYGLGGFSTTA